MPPLIAPPHFPHTSTARAPKTVHDTATALERRKRFRAANHRPTLLSTSDLLHLFTILATALEHHKNTAFPLSTHLHTATAHVVHDVVERRRKIGVWTLIGGSVVEGVEEKSGAGKNFGWAKH